MRKGLHRSAAALSAAVLLAASGPASANPEQVATLKRLQHATETAKHDHVASCLELARLFDDSADLASVQGYLKFGALFAHLEAPGYYEKAGAELERKGDWPLLCQGGYFAAILLRAKNRGAEAEHAMLYAREGLSHVAQIAAAAPAAPVPLAGYETASAYGPALASPGPAPLSANSPPATDAAAVSALHTAARSAGVRVALLIANGRYSAMADVPPLRTPAADVALIAASLRRAGFTDVAVVQNAGRAEMVEALRRFQDRADHADTALIYYAGHGLQSQGENYAIPTDARLADERSVPDEAVSQARLMEAMARTGKLKILVMDACRDNPFGSSMATEGATRGVTRGLARIVPPKSHTVVVYSAASGQQAQDGQGTNSPFASALSRRMLEPGVEIDLVLRRVDDDVLKATGGAQEPNVAGNLGADPFFFIPPNA